MDQAAMETRSLIDNLPPELLMEILSHLSWRQQLDVRRVSRQWLEVVDACLAHRQELHIDIEDHDTGLNTERLLNLLKSMPVLRRLYVSDRYCDDSEKLDISPASVDQLCDSCPRLELVSLDCTMDEAAVETLLRRLPGLRSLHLKRFKIEGDCLSLLPAELQSMSLHFFGLGTRKYGCLEHLSSCRQLRTLDLSGNLIASEELAVVPSACPQLERLSVANCWAMTGGWLSELRCCPQLRDLDLTCTWVLGEELSAVVASCPQLERLSVAGCSRLTWDWLRELRHCPRLRDLNLSTTRVSNRELEALVVACPQLERLVMVNCIRVLGDCLPKLRDCPWLKELVISGIGMPGMKFDLSGVLTACDRLERLGVAYTNTNPMLTFPAISLPGLTHLDLTGSRTDDNTFRRLPDLLPGLRDLRVNNCKKLTNSGLASVLPRLISLQVLDLRKTEAASIKTAPSLNGLPLKALAFDFPGAQSVSAVLQSCPSLTLLHLTEIKFDNAERMADDLVKYPLPTHREVTLIVDGGTEVKMLTAKLPKNIRVIRNRCNLWEERVGWNYER